MMADNLDLRALGNVIAQILSGQSMPSHGGSTPANSPYQSIYPGKPPQPFWPWTQVAEQQTPAAPPAGATPMDAMTDSGQSPVSPERIALEKLLRGSRY